MNSWTRPTWCPHSEHTYPSFHICIDPATPGHLLVIEKQKKKYVPGPLTEEAKAKLSEAQTARWARIHAKNEKRNREILELNDAGHTYRQIAARFGLGAPAVSTICKRMRAARFEEQYGNAAHAS